MTRDFAHLRAFLIAITLVGASAELAYAVVNVSAMPVFIPTIGLSQAAADYWIGIVGTAFLLTEGILKGPLGALSDRIGRKPLILLGPILSLFTALLTPQIHHPYALVALRVLDGIGAAALWPAIFSLIADNVPAERRATAMSLFNVAYILGIALGPSLGGNVNQFAQTGLHMTEAHSKVASFYVAALLFGLTALISLFCLPSRRSKLPTRKSTDREEEHVEPDKGKAGHDAEHSEAGHEEAGHGESGMDMVSLKQMLARMPMTLLITFLIFLGVGFVMLYVKRYATEAGGPFHMTEQEFGNLLILPALFIGALSVPMGTLGDRIGKPLAVKIGIGICAASFWLLLIFPARPSLIGFGTLVGAGFVLAFPAWMALITEQSDERQHGAVVGAVSTAQGLGAILGSILSANLYPRDATTIGTITLPAHSIPFVLCGTMLSLAFLLSLFTVKSVKPIDEKPINVKR